MASEAELDTLFESNVTCTTSLIPENFQYRQIAVIPPEDAKDGCLGCQCSARCISEDEEDTAPCPCAQANPLGTPYTGSSHPQHYPTTHDIDFAGFIYECGEVCSCIGGPHCQVSVIGKGVVHRLRVGPAPGKGLGVFAEEEIPQGAWISEYGGEHIGSHDATKRLDRYDRDPGSSHALLVVRLMGSTWGVGLRFNIDATRIGNVAKFYNHSCDGGNMVCHLIQRTGEAWPRAGLFAKRAIAKGEELTFGYGPPNGGQGKPLKRCRCGAAACMGYLPSESV